MGLLDEAIRQHLDLKRRHGADPAEIERAEREALGPVRRGPEEPDDLPLEPATGADHDPEYEGDEELGWDEPLHGEADDHSPLFEEPEHPDDEPGPVHGHGHNEDEPPSPSEEHEPPTANKDQEAWVPEGSPGAAEPGGDPGPSGEPRSARSHPVEHPGQETAEYNVEVEEQLDKPSEDVLEETPEFLQDTPDHDRLWFEQRPPRDFDFDG
jgi:hypothetical protein